MPKGNKKDVIVLVIIVVSIVVSLVLLGALALIKKPVAKDLKTENQTSSLSSEEIADNFPEKVFS